MLVFGGVSTEVIFNDLHCARLETISPAFFPSSPLSCSRLRRKIVWEKVDVVNGSEQGAR
jgi:hypothetical protein